MGRPGAAFDGAPVGSRALNRSQAATRTERLPRTDAAVARRIDVPASLPLWRLVERTLLRDPWAWSLVPVMAAVGVGFAGRTPEVALVSLFGVAQLVVPPLVLALAVPTLATRGVWSLWAPATPRPGLAFVAAALGAASGLAWPAALAALVAAAIAGIAAPYALALGAAVALTALLWSLLGALLAALTLHTARALAGGLAFWALGAIVYEPALVAFAMLAADRPFEPLLALALLANPAELGRVALVRALDVPVFAGPTGVLVARWLGAAPLAVATAATLAWSALLAVAAAVVFARRDR